MQEMEQMRSQLNLLKQKLDKQEIVNDRLMRQSMRQKMSWINKYRWLALLAIPVVALCFLPMTFQLGLSWWLYGFTVLFVAVDAVLDWHVNRTSDRDFMRGNLMETAQRLTRMKQIRNQQLLFGMIVLVVWMGWLVYEVYMAGHSAPAGSDLLSVSWCYLGGIFVGGVIGLILGLKIFFKMQRTNDEIIDQIEEMEIEK
jgi:sterol desaturase/sphingolipid hydroxylase (fatty acid hydroxylase superfamily)